MQLDKLYEWLCENQGTREQLYDHLRESEFLTLTRNWTQWSRNLYERAGSEVRIVGLYYNGQTRRRLNPGDGESYFKFINSIGTGETLMYIHTGDEDAYLIPFEWLEGLYQSCYDKVEQWWRCDGDRRRVEGHRWQTPLIRGRRYSEGYIKEHMDKCVVNGMLYPKNELTMTPDGYMCHESLMNSRFRTCTSCGALAHESPYIRLCEECGERQEYDTKQRDYISGYHSCNHWKALKLPHETADYDLLGCELEVDCGDEDVVSESVEIDCIRSYDCVADIQSDGSLQGGFEVITHPCTHGYLKVNMGALLTDAVYYQDYECHEKAGFHVHVSRSSLPGRDDCKKLDYFVHKYKDQVCDIARRNSHEWARFTKNPSNGIHGDSFGMSTTRYSAINFENNRTVEFRLFAQPTTKRRLQIYLDFVQSLVEFVRMSDVIDGDAWAKYSRYVKANKARFDALADEQLIEKEMEQHVYCDS